MRNLSKAYTVAVFCISLLSGSNSVHALLGSDACRRVTFTVDNQLNRQIEVRRFELHSVDEGRWLNENFRDILVPAGANDFVVQVDETVEYAEGDLIDQIRVHYRFLENGRWENRESIDNDIRQQKCVADKVYNATVSQ